MKERMAFDSARTIDGNGYMHVVGARISKEQVVPYLGREIPGYESLGLTPDKVYYGYRSADELSRPETLASLNGIPIQIEHHPDSAEDPQTDARVGSTGTDAKFISPYLLNSLHIQSEKAINNIKTGATRELSLGYRYVPVWQSGEYGGQRYDFRITEIECNHVALVEEGRAGRDVVVPDHKPLELKRMEEKDAGQLADAAIEAVNNLRDLTANKAEEDTGPDNAGKEAADSREELIDQLIAEVTKAGIDGDKVREQISAIIAAEDDGEEVKAEDDAAPESGAETGAEDDGEEAEAVDEEPEGESKTGVKSEEQGKTLANTDDDEMAQIIKDCGLDGEPDEVKQSFIKGLKYGTKPKADEGEKKAVAGDTARAVKAVMQMLGARQKAADECRAVIGNVNVLAFDSAGAIYRAALKQMGVSINGMSGRECRAAYRAAVAVRGKARGMAQDAAIKVKPSALTGILNNVKVGY